MADLRDLAKLMTDKSRSYDESTNALKKRAAIAIFRYLVQNTPVDTSKALSNWQVTLDTASAHRIGALVLGSKGSSQSASSSQAIAIAERIISTAKPGQNIWIQNKLPYIRRLNDGYSNQAPAGFVEAAQLIGRKITEQGL